MLFASSGDLIFMNTTASPAAATQPNSNNNNAVNDVILQVAETIGLERRDIQELGSFANADAEIEDFVSGLERRSPQAVGRKKKKV